MPRQSGIKDWIKNLEDGNVPEKNPAHRAAAVRGLKKVLKKGQDNE